MTYSRLRMLWIVTALPKASAAVKSMKLLLNKVVGPHPFFIDELYSLIVEVEPVLNSRPLTPLDSASDDGIEVLTPGHFLIGKALKSVPAPDLSKRNISGLSRWYLRQRLIADFWERWSNDYIISLNNFKKDSDLFKILGPWQGSFRLTQVMMDWFVWLLFGHRKG